MATVVFLVCGGEVLATRVLRRKCGVQDSMKIHPERPRQPLPGFKFTERINLRLMSRAFGDEGHSSGHGVTGSADEVRRHLLHSYRVAHSSRCLLGKGTCPMT